MIFHQIVSCRLIEWRSILDGLKGLILLGSIKMIQVFFFSTELDFKLEILNLVY